MTVSRHTPARHSDTRKNTLLAIALVCIAYGLFNIGDAALKMLAGKYHFTQIMVTNCVIIIVCMVATTLFRKTRGAFKMQNTKLVLIRAGLSCMVSIMNILALPFIKLTTFYTLVFTSPFWVALLATVLLKEKMEGNRLAVILAGFATTMFVFRPGGGLFDVHAVLILVGAFFYSCSLIAMRRLGPKESRAMIIIMGSLVSTAVAVVIAVLDPFLRQYVDIPYPAFYLTVPTPAEWGLFFLMGSLGAISVTCIAYAYQNAPSAAVIAPYHYTQIVWGTILGYVLFKEVPDDKTILGAALIIAAGLYLLVTEARRKPKIMEEVPESAAAT